MVLFLVSTTLGLCLGKRLTQSKLLGFRVELVTVLLCRLLSLTPCFGPIFLRYSHHPQEPLLAVHFWHFQLSSALDGLFIPRDNSCIFWQVIQLFGCCPVTPSELWVVLCFSSALFLVSGCSGYLPSPSLCSSWLLPHSTPQLNL